MQPFIAPGFNLPLAWTADLLFPVLIKAVQNIDDIEIKSEDKQMLRGLKDDRLIFFTNHPTTAEPPISYYIGNLMGSRFRYMASRQVFDWTFGLTGKIISNLGAFSIIAGISDRDSLKTARESLARPAGKLVLFPEGEPTSGENDSLMPFQPGLAQLGFWALEDARKVDPLADITILPGFIKYIYKGTPAALQEHLEESIRVMENKLGVNPGNRNLLRRFLHFGKVLLEQAEREYSIPVASDQDFDYRIGRIRHAILDRIADRFTVKNYDRKADAIGKLRQLFAWIEMISIGYPDPTLPKLTPEELAWAHGECVKAFDFIVIKKDYLVSNPTPERFYEWLARFESYVHGKKPRALGGEPSPRARKAIVKFAKPFKLSEFYPADKKARRSALDDLLKKLRKDMQGMLDESQQLTRAIFKPGDIGGE
ncbi:MAG: 1-acyl-sn-glycerol-3-phosphate acyltransferase [Spirochaetia bacterium]|nr:1-acyl-sn-glycerol-3-phosphate acyltransferase [Spirochaetia bacterium]